MPLSRRGQAGLTATEWEPTVEPGSQMDMQQLFAAAQQMQDQLMNAQQELADAEVQGTAGGGLVTATVNGQGELVELTISAAAIDVADPAETAETVADLVLAAVRDAYRAAGAGRSLAGPVRFIARDGGTRNRGASRGSATEELRKPGHLAHPAERGQRPHLLLLEVPGRPVRVTDGGQHQIGDRFGGLGRIGGVDRGCTDRQIHQFALAVDGRGHQPAARGPFHLGVCEFLLCAHELVLHLLRGGEQLLHVHLAAWFHCRLPLGCGQPRLAGPGTRARPLSGGIPGAPVAVVSLRPPRTGGHHATGRLADRSQQAGAHTPFLARPVALAGLLEDATAETAAPAG